MQLLVQAPFIDSISRDSVGVPSIVLNKLDLSDYDYVKIQYLNKSCIFRVHAINEESDEIVRMRNREREKISCNVDDIVTVEPFYDAKSEIATIRIGRVEDVGENIGRLHHDMMNKINVSINDSIELFNKDNGGRIILDIKEHKLKYNNAILLTKDKRKLLKVDEKDINIKKYGVRKNPFKNIKKGIIDKILKFIVGYKYLNLRVEVGLDNDEGKKIVRLSSSNLKILGVKENDIVDVYWRDNKLSCRALEFPEYYQNSISIEDQSEIDFEISLCSSERDSINVDLYDVVSIRRSPSYVLKKNLDRVLVTAMSIPSFFLLLYQEFKINYLISMFTSILLGIVLTVLVFTQIRTEV